MGASAQEYENWRRDMQQRYGRAGLEHRYDVKRVGDTEGKHDECRYFVLDPQHDPIAREALAHYSDLANARGFIPLSNELNAWLWSLAGAASPTEGSEIPTPEASGAGSIEQATEGGAK